VNAATLAAERAARASDRVDTIHASHAMDVETAWEREYWAKHFHVSEHELLRIVRRVGPDSVAVLAFIREQGRPPA
jgi:hypothetical protein